MAKLEVRVCDADPVVGEDVTTWGLIPEGGETVWVDLCQRHAQPLQKLVASKTDEDDDEAEAKMPAPIRRRYRTIEEIEAMKKSGRL